MMALSYIIGQKKFPIQYDIKSVVIYSVLAAVFFLAGMQPTIESEILRLGYRTLLLFFFVGIVIKRDLPLQELPYVGRHFTKKK